MNKIYIAVAFIVGMLFMHSLTGEYARYGMAINDEVEDCEIYNDECDYIVAPVNKVPSTTDENNNV